MAEDETRKARQRKRTSQSKRFIAPDNVPVDRAWIGAPPKSRLADKNKESRTNQANPEQATTGTTAPKAFSKANPYGANPYAQAPTNSQIPDKSPQTIPVQQPQYLQRQDPSTQAQQYQAQQTQYLQQQQQAPSTQVPQTQAQQTQYLQQQQAPSPQAQQTQAQQTQYLQQQQAPAPQAQQTQAKQTQYPQQQQTPASQAQQTQAQQTQYLQQQAPSNQAQQTQAPQTQAQQTQYPQLQQQAPAPLQQQQKIQAPPEQQAEKADSQIESSSNIITSIFSKKRRITKNWYWPEADDANETREGTLSATNSTMGLLAGNDQAQTHTNPNQLARAIDDFNLSQTSNNQETEQFNKACEEIEAKGIHAEMDVRVALDRLARALSDKSTGAELAELSPRLSSLIKENIPLLQDLIEICRAGESGVLQVETISKMFEQLNRIFDAQIPFNRRDQAVKGLLTAIANALRTERGFVINEPQLCQHILVSKHPDKAAELLFAVLTASRINNEEISLRAFKFDRERLKTQVRIPRLGLDLAVDAEQNYFSALFWAITINAVIQEKDPQTRYINNSDKPRLYRLEEKPVKHGLKQVTLTEVSEFPGLSYEQISWINRQFAGLKLRGRLPDRLKY